MKPVKAIQILDMLVGNKLRFLLRPGQFFVAFNFIKLVNHRLDALDHDVPVWFWQTLNAEAE